MSPNPFPSLPKALPIEMLFDAVPPEKRRLGLFLLFAAMAHLLAFSFIRINYPQPQLKSPSRLHVTLANAGAVASNRPSLQFWYALIDPSLLILPREPLVQTGKVEIAVLSADEKSDSETIPSLTSRNDKVTFLPDALAPLSDRAATLLEVPQQTFTYPDITPPTPQSLATTLSVEPTLVARLSTPLPSLPVQTSRLLTESGVTIIRLGVDAEGRVEYVLIDQSCGKSTVDSVAVQALRKIKFEPAAKPGLLWGQVTVYWQFEPEPAPAPAPATPPAKP